MTKDFEITDDVRAKLHSMIDWRCIKVICILSAVISAITLPSITYAYFSDKNHAEDFMVKVDKKLDTLLSMQSQVVVNTNSLADLKKNQQELKMDVRSILIAGGEEK